MCEGMGARSKDWVDMVEMAMSTTHKAIKTMYDIVLGLLRTPKKLQANKPDFKEPVAPGMRKRVKKKKHLSMSDKIQMVHRILVDFEKLDDVAREYRVSSHVA